MCKIIFWAFIRAIDIKPIQLKWSVKQASNNKNLMRTITALIMVDCDSTTETKKEKEKRTESQVMPSTWSTTA